MCCVQCTAYYISTYAHCLRVSKVYPKLQPHGGTTESQDGCYDGYAQTGVDYALQSGAQITAVRAMIKAVAGI